jgi:hypothetical protein
MPPTPHRRRASLLLPFAAAAVASACATREEAAPPQPPPGPIGYRYLTPLPLNVASLEISEADPPRPPPPGDVGSTLSPRPAEAVRIMARDRLSAVGSSGRAAFAVTRAEVTRAPGGGETALACALACRLEILSAEGGRLGFVEAKARAAVSGAEAARAGAADRLLRRTMDGLNVEFEFQARRALRDWLVAVAPGSQGAMPAPPPGGVTREDLPRS